MAPKASLALFAGLALVLANAYRETAQKNGWSAVASSWQRYGVEAAVIAGAAFLADRSDRAADIVLLALAVLWLLFAMNTWGHAATSRSVPNPPQTAKVDRTTGNVRRVA